MARRLCEVELGGRERDGMLHEYPQKGIEEQSGQTFYDMIPRKRAKGMFLPGSDGSTGSAQEGGRRNRYGPGALRVSRARA